MKRFVMIQTLRYLMVVSLMSLTGQIAIAAPQTPVQDSGARPAFEQKPRGEYRHSGERSERHYNNADGAERGNYSRGRSEWKTGAPIPESYRFADYTVDYTQYPKLTAPSRYQIWIKVDNRFILINVLTNTTLKVVLERRQ